MNINFENNSVRTERFGDILAGECFVIDYNTPHQAICMKTYDDVDNVVNDRVNAVNLQDGENYNIENGVRVVPLNAELKVWLLDQ